MVHIRKPTQMPCLEIRPKMPQLHEPITLSKMVVWGWYITHFDRRDLLNSKKQVWGGFRNLPGLYGPICEIFDFFGNFDLGDRYQKKWFFWLQSPKKWSKINFFSNFFDFSTKYGTSAPEWYIHIGRTPNRSNTRVFWNLVVRIYKAMCIFL